MMMSTNEVQQHQRDWLFHGLHKQLMDSMCYLYDDAITYPQLMTSAQKAESEQEDHAGEGICVRYIKVEGKDDIMRLSKHIAQLWVAVQKPQNSPFSKPQQLGSERDGSKRIDNKGIKCF